MICKYNYLQSKCFSWWNRSFCNANQCSTMKWNLTKGINLHIMEKLPYFLMLFINDIMQMTSIWNKGQQISRGSLSTLIQANIQLRFTGIRELYFLFACCATEFPYNTRIFWLSSGELHKQTLKLQKSRWNQMRSQDKVCNCNKWGQHRIQSC